MKESKLKNLENPVVGSRLTKTIRNVAITCIVLCVPTLLTWPGTVLYSLGDSHSCNASIHLGISIAYYLPFIGIFSACISSWFAIYILKIWQTGVFLTIAITAIILIGVLVISISLQECSIYHFDKVWVNFMIAIFGIIPLVSFWSVKDIWYKL
jgi:hypothetical protein